MLVCDTNYQKNYFESALRGLVRTEQYIFIYSYDIHNFHS